MQHIQVSDGKLSYAPAFLPSAESDRMLAALLQETPWRQEEITLFGRKLNQPRLTAWYGDPGAAYTYSGLRLEPLPWTVLLQELKTFVEKETGALYNSVLLNLYRHGQDSMGWHSDDEPELGLNPVIASVSFGGTRRFQLRHKSRADLPTVSLDLAHGSLLLMAGPLQHHWKHQLPKTKKPVAPRLNLTFRWIRH